MKVLAASAAIFVVAIAAPSSTQSQAVQKSQIRLTAAALAVPAHRAPHYKAHDPGCRSKACDQRMDRKWAKAHRPAFYIGSVEACEANYESGEPGSRDPKYINWHMESGGYEGAYSWLPSTWQRQRFPGYPDRAVDATPEQQTLVFRRYKNVGEWPPLANC